MGRRASAAGSASPAFRALAYSPSASGTCPPVAASAPRAASTSKPRNSATTATSSAQSAASSASSAAGWALDVAVVALVRAIDVDAARAPLAATGGHVPEALGL